MDQVSPRQSEILEISHVPPATVSKDATALEAVAVMVDKNVGAVAVVEGGNLRGIFTERDLMAKVIHPGLDPAAVAVADVMTTQVEALTIYCREGDALRTMSRGHFRHMPVCDGDGKVLGVLSLRNLLQHRLDTLADELDSLESFLSADGPGG